MISFKTFITEANMAPLFHATSLDGFEGILASNTLKATVEGMGQRHGKPTNFFTRNLTNAKHYGDLVHPSTIIFKIDQQKLNQRYRLQPIHNWSAQYYKRHSDRPAKGSLSQNATYGVEFEEIIEGDVKNFLSYVTNIYTTEVPENVMSYIDQAAKDTLTKYNLKIEELPKR